MRESIAGLLTKADMAVGAASEVIEDSALRPLANAARALRVRLDYPDDVLIVAFAGGTGSGKSSLVNALVGESVAQVGGIRPTTDEAMAIVSPDRLADIAAYLRGLGIRRVRGAGVEDWLCLIDMPDSDSVEIDHRLEVEALLPRVDAVVWVADPEKYRDDALHGSLVRPLADYASQFVFVLNQADRIESDELEKVIYDFTSALVADGIASPTVLATVADPTTGPPEGIEELAEALGEIDRRGVLAKMLIDLDRSTSSLLESIGRPGLDFDRRAGAAVTDVARLLSEERLDDAIDRLTGFLGEIGDEVGGLSRDRLSRIVASVPSDLEAIIDDLGGSGDASRRPLWRRKDPADIADSRQAALGEAIEERSIVAARDCLRQRAQAIGAVNELSLAVSAVRSRHAV